MAHRQIGLSYLVEYSGCPQSILMNEQHLLSLLSAAAELSGIKPIHEFVKSDISGATGFVTTPDASYSFHSFAEFGYVAVNIFTSRMDLKIQSSIDFLVDELNAKQVNWQKYPRGPNSQLKPLNVPPNNW